MKTYSAKVSEVEREWFIVDAEGMTLGRMATEVARVLRGKHKPMFSPNLDCGDHVIVINAAKVQLSGNKASLKMRYRHSGYPGGIKSQTYAESIAKDASGTVKASIVGMLPKTRLGRQQATKLKVYDSETHPHSAQNPKPLQISSQAQEAS